MAGLKSVTDKVLVVKKINDFYETRDGKNDIPKRQLILLAKDSTYQPTCTEEVLTKVEEFKEYRFIIENDFVNRKQKIVGVLFEDKK